MGIVITFVFSIVITFLAFLSGCIVSAQLDYAPPVLDETHKAIDSKEIKCLGEFNFWVFVMPQTIRLIVTTMPRQCVYRHRIFKIRVIILHWSHWTVDLQIENTIILMATIKLVVILLRHFSKIKLKLFIRQFARWLWMKCLPKSTKLIPKRLWKLVVITWIMWKKPKLSSYENRKHFWPT